jgi:hypothetical protein
VPHFTPIAIAKLATQGIVHLIQLASKIDSLERVFT